MYLHLGQSVVVPHRDVVASFDLDNTTWSRRTRGSLEKAEKRGQVVDVSGDLPKSFVLCRDRTGGTRVYLSQLSAATLRGRAGERRLLLSMGRVSDAPKGPRGPR